MKNVRTSSILTILLVPALLLGACIDSRHPSEVGCEYEGRTYVDQEEFMEECNQCVCYAKGGGVLCTAMACPQAALTCTYKGRVYGDQEIFMDDCNRCQCNPEGTVGVGCTLVACPEPDDCPTSEPAYDTACEPRADSCDYFIRESLCMPGVSDYDLYVHCRCDEGRWSCWRDSETCSAYFPDVGVTLDGGAPDPVMPDAMAPRADGGW